MGWKLWTACFLKAHEHVFPRPWPPCPSIRVGKPCPCFKTVYLTREDQDPFGARSGVNELSAADIMQDLVFREESASCAPVCDWVQEVCLMKSAADPRHLWQSCHCISPPMSLHLFNHCHDDILWTLFIHFQCRPACFQCSQTVPPSTGCCADGKMLKSITASL